QGATQMSVADFADPDFFLHRLAGTVLPRIQAGVGHPLANAEVWSQQNQFPEQLQGAGLSDPRKTQQQIKPLLELRVRGDQLQSLAGNTLDGSLVIGQAALQLPPNDLW